MVIESILWRFPGRMQVLEAFAWSSILWLCQLRGLANRGLLQNPSLHGWGLGFDENP